VKRRYAARLALVAAATVRWSAARGAITGKGTQAVVCLCAGGALVHVLRFLLAANEALV
jgi:hypothetical protein